MKFNRLQKILSCLLMSVLALQASYLFLAVPAKATNTQTWTEITPRQIGDPAYNGWYGTSPTMGPNDLRYANHPNYYTSQWTTIADLVETKPNGSKVFHFFVGMPNSNMYSWSNFTQGRIYHYSSTDQYKTWNLISPSDWGSYGGGSHMTLKAINKTWTDSNGSVWNKKLFLYCNSSDYLYSNFYGQTAYQVMKSLFYRYDGNGGATGWVRMVVPTDANWRYTYGSYYSAGQIKGHYGPKMYFDYVDCTDNGIDDGTIVLLAPYCFSGGTYSTFYFRLRFVKFNGTTNDLMNTTSYTNNNFWSTYTEISTQYSMYYYQINLIFDMEKVTTPTNQYLFLSTVSPTGNGYYPYQGNGLLYRYDVCNNTVLYPAASAAPTGQVISGVTLVSVSGIQYYRFTFITAGGVTKTGYIRRPNYSDPTIIYMNFGGDYDYTWSFYYSYSYYWSNYIYPGAWYFPNPKGLFDYAVESESSTEVYFDAVAFMPYYGYGSYYYSTILDGSPAPLSLEFFKNELYAGGKSGILRRTSNYNELNFNNWSTVSPITANNNLGQVRTMNSYVTALGKMIKKNAFGVEEDVTLYIGGFQGAEYSNTGEGILYATNGGTTLTYFIVEDEWRYTKDDTAANRRYKGTLYMIYDIYPSSLGLIVSFSSSRRRYATSDGGGFGDRYFPLYNASPTCEILVNPDPVINERGSDTEVCFTFTPIGGYGSGDVQIYLEGFPTNVYLPKKDIDGNPINTQISDSPAVIKSVNMNGGILTVCAVIRSTRSAMVGTYTMCVTINDLVLGIPIQRCFTFMIIYPKPGFSERVSPSQFNLYPGDCDLTKSSNNSKLDAFCGPDNVVHCQMVNIDIESRNEFEENVVIGAYWVLEPPSADISIQWQQSPFIYDYIDDSTVEVVTRKNIATRYQILVSATPNTSVGVWKAKLFFLSGTIKHFKTLTITVLPPKPSLEITSLPKIIRVVPGATAEYQIQILSKGYVGPAALSLANVPPDVEVVEFHANNPPPGYADNYIDIFDGEIEYATLILRTYAVTIDPYPPNNVTITNMTATKNVITWDGSKQGTNPIAGYEIWRGLSQYTDKAIKLGSVNATTTMFDDDNFDRTKTYYYFVRAFDDQTPPNYSKFSQSDPFSMSAIKEDSQLLSTTAIPHEGSTPGRFEIYVIATGSGFDSQHNQAAVCDVGICNLQIYEQVEDMATPFLSDWGWLLILLAMVSAFFVVSKRAEPNKS